MYFPMVSYKKCLNMKKNAGGHSLVSFLAGPTLVGNEGSFNPSPIYQAVKVEGPSIGSIPGHHWIDSST